MSNNCAIPLNSPEFIVCSDKLCKRYVNGKHITTALNDVSLRILPGSLTALVGPDGAGKTTLMRLLAGLLQPTEGHLQVLGLDVRTSAHVIQARIAYMPQRFGLYEDLTVQENLDLYADMHGVPQNLRPQRYAQLLEMTDLAHFTRRLAGRLSGGMKQKLGLACTLVRSPELLLLDEPTVGVDPLSRRELRLIIRQLVNVERLTVLTSTAYLDEAEHCHRAIVLSEGKVLADCEPSALSGTAEGHVFLLSPPIGGLARNLQVQLLDHPLVADALPQGGMVRMVLRHPHALEQLGLAGFVQPKMQAPNFEDGFMLLLAKNQPKNSSDIVADALKKPVMPANQENVIEVHDLVRNFGAFTAVDHVSFVVKRGEIFGLLGPNGAGKTTTFRMLCGLLAASSGSLRVLGQDMRLARSSARRRIGYMAQKFALYGELTVSENLNFFASAYDLHGSQRQHRLAWAIEQFGLEAMLNTPSGQLPGGFRQRLAMAAALMHEPEVLFLDEPTSGADPQARRDFWRRITGLAAQGITIVVTTHFMEEAEYCDRALIQDAGRILVQGTPAEIRRHAPVRDDLAPTMEDAFINIVNQARQHEA